MCSMTGGSMRGEEVWEWFLSLYIVSVVLALTYVTLFEDKVKAIMNEGLPHYTLRSKLYLGVLCWLLIFIPVINTLFAYYMLKINIGKVMGWDKNK